MKFKMTVTIDTYNRRDINLEAWIYEVDEKLKSLEGSVNYIMKTIDLIKRVVPLVDEDL